MCIRDRSYVVAISLEAKKGYQSEYHPIHAVLGSILDVDVAAMWRPTSENFFDRINKTACLAALTDVGGSELAARYAASKKTELSSTCAKLFSGDAIVEESVKEAALSWLPEAMKFTLPAAAAATVGESPEEGDAQDPGSEPEGEDTEDDISETAEEEAVVDA